MRKQRIVVIALVMMLSGLAAGVRAQNQHPNSARGFTPTGAYSSFDVDHINLFNGNLVITIPLGQPYPVNGNLSYRFNLVYNSFIWTREWTCEGPDEPTSSVFRFYSPLLSLQRRALCGFVHQGETVIKVCNRGSVIEEYYQPALINPYLLLQEGKQRDVDDRCQSFTTINPASNAGVGWQLHFGKIYLPRRDIRDITTMSTEKLTEVYQSPDGSEHQFFFKLHEDDPAESDDMYYTRDGSYLRMWRNPAPSNESYGTAEYSYKIEFPNGETHYFQRLRIVDGLTLANGPLETLPQYEDKIVKIEDRFGNNVTFAYFDDNSDEDDLRDNRWEISDSVGRKHVIDFQKTPLTHGSITVIDTVELETVNTGSDTYDFSYDNQTLEVSKPHAWRSFLNFPPYTYSDDENATMMQGFLTSVKLPDGSQYSMPFDSSYRPTILGAGALAPGALVGMTLPTGGRIEWDYNTPDDRGNAEVGTGYIFSPGISGLQHARVSPGVRERRVYEMDSTTQTGLKLTGTWRYDPKLGPLADGCTIATLAEPCGAYHIVNKVTAPTGDYTEYFFSVYPHLSPGSETEKLRRTVDQPHRADYALPFSKDPRNAGERAKIAADNNGKPLFISSITYRQNQTIERKTYVRYEGDKYAVNDGFADTIEYNPRVVASRTVFADDGNKYAEVQYSDFDGLGHYRKTQTYGNIGNDRRLEITNNNPGRGTYLISPDTNDRDPSITNFYTPFPENQPWVLGNYDKKIASNFSNRSSAYFKFDANGLLESKRIAKEIESDINDYSSVNADNINAVLSSTDVLVKYGYATNGNLTSENYFGGARQGGLSAATLFPTPANANSEYQITYGYACKLGSVTKTTSVVSSKTYRAHAGEASFSSLDNDIDCSTGLPEVSRDSAGVTTIYEYGSMGRLRWMKQQQGSWDEIEYHPHLVGTFSPARVIVKRRANAATSGALLAESIYVYDSLGRLTTEKQSKPGNTYQARYTNYNVMGWLTDVSEWLENEGTGNNKKTLYSDFDPLGRPAKITAPDGKVTSVAYKGEREVKRTVKTGTKISSTRVVTEEDAVTTEVYDRHGRLTQLSEPSGADGASTTWSYFYNLNHKLALASVKDPSAGGKTQNRVFGYDNLGNLTTESHPERGWAQYGEHDTMGNLGKSFDGVNWLSFSYDGHARLKVVQELNGGAGRPLREFTYDTAATFGLGKLATATRYNYVMSPYSMNNLARGKVATQSSTEFGATASLAVDGNNDGRWGGGSLTHTQNTFQPWWQVDTGSVSYIDSIKIWNRTDCCADRLSNFYVLVSDQPFGASDTLDMQRARPGVSSFYFAGVAGPTTEFLIGRTGRYVRVYLTGGNFLSLAEVEVIGRPTTQTSVPVREEYNYGGIDGRLGTKVTRLSSASPNPYIFTQTFTYDALGNLRMQTYPECSNGACISTSNTGGAQNRPWTVHYNYDAGWLTSLGSGTNTTNNNYASSISYNNNGTIQSIAHGNSVTDTIDQDPNYLPRPARIRVQRAGVTLWDSGAGAASGQENYKYDGAGNITRIGNDWYTYDRVDRVVEGSAMSMAMKRSYSYDAFGNVLTMNTYAGVVNPTTSNAPVLFTTNADSATNRMAAQYDAAGNVQGLLPNSTNLQPQQYYHYDAANMIKNAPGQTYLYGPNDERVWMVNNNGNAFAPAPTPTPVPPPVPPGDVVWVEDGLPAGAQQSAGWNWTTTTNPAPYTGARAHQPVAGTGPHQQFFTSASNVLRVNSWETLFAYVYLDPLNPPREVMLQWNDGSWEHRAYWGENLITAAGVDGTTSRQYIGKLPAAGQWVRLEVPAWRVGLEGRTINGLAFTLYDGRATWDRAGKAPAAPPPGESVWVEDGLPAGAQASAGWNWIATTNPAPFSGALAHQSPLLSGPHQEFFQNATTMAVRDGDMLFAYVYLDPASPPQEVMLQWNVNGNWEHRAYWGANLLAAGVDGTPSRQYMGELPPLGQWVRLEVPAAKVGLAGLNVSGLAFTLYDGRATWDRAGRATAPSPPAGDVVWVGDAVPAGAGLAGDNETWQWFGGVNPASISGSLAHHSNTVSGMHQHFFVGATNGMTVNAGDKLIAYVYLDPASPPREVMLQWNVNGNWEHRAYWGENLLVSWGVNGTNSRRPMGTLPPSGRWMRLEVPAHLVGLEGQTVTGMAFTLYDGRAVWDHGGKVNAPPPPVTPSAPPSYTNSIVETVTLRGLGNEVLREYEINNDKWRWAKDYIYAGTKLLASEDRVGGTRHYHLDHLGTPRVITNNEGTAVQAATYQYFPFGEEATLPPPLEERLRFTGHERDQDRSGEQLDYMHARYYRAGSAKFLSVDPGRDWDPKQPQSWNSYAYVRNNPMNATDPTGRQSSLQQSYNAIFEPISHLDAIVTAAPRGMRAAARKHVPFILDAAKAEGLNREELAYVLATMQIESEMGGSMYERYNGNAVTYFETKYGHTTTTGQVLGNTNPGDGYTYRGTGYVHLTGKGNFEKLSGLVGLDLVNNPSAASDPRVAAKIAVTGSLYGQFTTLGLGRYINNTQTNFIGARAVINGQDRAALISGFAQNYLRALNRSNW